MQEYSYALRVRVLVSTSVNLLIDFLNLQTYVVYNGLIYAIIL